MEFKGKVHKILSENVQYTPDGCWLYTGNIDTGTGYGRIQIDNVRYHIHRLSAHVFLNLDLEDDKQFACHKCENRLCFNPAHLYVGNNKTNQLDYVSDKCPRGHDLIEGNIRWRKRKNGNFYRNCLICEKENYKNKRVLMLEALRHNRKEG